MIPLKASSISWRVGRKGRGAGRARARSGHAKPVTSVAFRRTPPALASGSEDRTVRLWDPVTGTP